MITKTTTSPFRKSNGDIIARDNAAKLGIGLDSPVGTIDVDMGSTGWSVSEVTLADEAEAALETLVPGALGWLFISDSTLIGEQVAGSVYLHGASNDVTEMLDPMNKIAVIDSNGFLCIFPDDDGTYTIKNRIGNYEKTFGLMWLGED